MILRFSLAASFVATYGAFAALAPLPGSILVTRDQHGSILQYDALTGQQIGNLDVYANQQQFAGILGIAVKNNTIYVSGGAAGNPLNGTGTVDPVTGQFVPVHTGLFLQNFDTLSDGFLAGGEGQFRGVYSNTFQGLYGVRLEPGNGEQPDYYGTATTSNQIITTWYNSNHEIQFWDYSGNRIGIRQFINPNPQGQLHGLEYDEESNAFWVSDTGGSISILRRYGPISSTPEWSVPIPGAGIGLDLAYIPIPAAPTALMFTAGLLTLGARRKR